MSALICALRSSVSVPPMISVSIGPGATEFTVMLCGPISRANARVNPMTAALDALYGTFENVPPPRCAEIDETLTIRPAPAAIIAGSTRWVTRKVPRMLTLNTRSHSAGVTSRNSVGELTPAMLASPMIGGRADSNCATAAFTEFSSETSAPTPRVDTEYLSATSSAVSLAAASSMSRIATDHPSAASRSAVARPMPRGDAPPVTTAVRSVGSGELMRWLPSSRGCLWSSLLGGQTFSCQVLDSGAQGFALRGSRLIQGHPGRACRQALQGQARLDQRDVGAVDRVDGLLDAVLRSGGRLFVASLQRISERQEWSRE